MLNRGFVGPCTACMSALHTLHACVDRGRAPSPLQSTSSPVSSSTAESVGGRVGGPSACWAGACPWRVACRCPRVPGVMRDKPVGDDTGCILGPTLLQGWPASLHRTSVSVKIAPAARIRRDRGRDFDQGVATPHGPRRSGRRSK